MTSQPIEARCDGCKQQRPLFLCFDTDAADEERFVKEHEL